MTFLHLARGRMRANNLVLKPEKVADHETSGTNIFYTVQKYLVKREETEKIISVDKVHALFY